MKALIKELFETSDLSDENLLKLLKHMTEADKTYLFECSLARKREFFGDSVYMRGLIEFTNYCKQHCLYCGIQAENKQVERYRLTKAQILDCCREGYDLGYRTFVMQGGEDPYFTDDRLVDIIKTIKRDYPDCAITLSIGERSLESYQNLKEAGVDRYLLRHETASEELYGSLHPGMSRQNRVDCLYQLKALGYQVGAGFMVGLPNQTHVDLVKDLRFLKTLQPEMVGIGPFIPQKDTPLGHETQGDVEMTLVMVALTRLMLPSALLPSTTALGTLDPKGREKALKAGANVVMPNLSPTEVRDQYALYDNKICTGDEAAHCRNCIEGRIKSVGFYVDMGRGDHPKHRVEKTNETRYANINRFA